ncbi:MULTISPECIES: response regulator transcription factor [Bacillaceae]|uniref:response regulator transcription factor n=1 Tax=Bacillaceae TaxID=186817 RepID=UPI00177D210F|nr:MULTISPECIES: response regulator transcription factor [Bacillaceae]MBT2637040.1 response regulator transcription factor [Bacillus sp. ISL-39]MBT2642345.1 response regulator transcription factor [Bacillus sp. ISL-41]MCM3572677.1 response regulator transcription factor [Mesobacillus subterraneus]UYZ23698.1 response regulator transcription factor [Mesobacillus jeotgali]
MNLMIIDDHEIVRDGLSMLLQQSFCIDGRICACDGYEAVKAAADFPADLVLLDLSMPGGLDGMTTLERLRKLLPDAKIVIFSMHDDIGYQKKAYEAGADGYLIKQLKRDDLIQSLDKILANQKVFDTHVWEDDSEGDQINLVDLPITKREKEVFILTVKGYSQKDIAERLDISVKTVENHRQKIGEKLGTHKRYEWVETALKYNVLQP